LGYPRAALFSFCSALTAFSLLSVIRASFRATHPAELMSDAPESQASSPGEKPPKKKEVSLFYLCDEVAHTSRGIEIALDDHYWDKTYANLKPRNSRKNWCESPQQQTFSVTLNIPAAQRNPRSRREKRSEPTPPPQKSSSSKEGIKCQHCASKEG
jgi:hypothetical protein